MAELTTRADVKRALGIPSAVSEHDTFMDTLIEVADQQILAYVGMAALTQTTVTAEAYDVPTRHETQLQLRNFPVQSVAAVVSAGSTLSTSAWYVEQRSGALRLTSGGSFLPEGKQQVKVTYTYGYSTIPADLSFAATLVCCAHFNRARHSGMVGEGMGSYRYTIDRDAMPGPAAAILAKYRRLFPKESI